VKHLSRHERGEIMRLMKRMTVSQIAQETGLDESTIREYITLHFSTDTTKLTHQKTEIFTPSHIQQRVNQISWGWFKKRWYVFAGLATLTFLVYANSLPNAFVSDDLALTFHPLGTFEYVFSQPQLFTRKIFYSFVFIFFGREPWAFRSINILFHIGTVWTAFVVFWVISKKQIALITSLLLSVHPVTVEAVAWISAGVHPQFTFILLIAFLFYMKSFNSMKYFWISFTLFVLGVLTSEKAIIFPVLILLYEWSLGTIQVNKKKLFLLFGISTLLALTVAFYAFERISGLINGHYVDSGIDNPFVTVPTAISTYFQLLIWPGALSFYQTEILPSMWVFYIKILGTIVYFASIIISFRKNKFIFFCLSFFFVSLLPMLLPIRIAWITAERYAYMGSIGIFAVAGYFFSKLLSRKKYFQNTLALEYLSSLLFRSARLFE
jgi:hypothetical protein